MNILLKERQKNIFKKKKSIKRVIIDLPMVLRSKVILFIKKKKII